MKLSKFIKDARKNGHTFKQIEAVVTAMKNKEISRDGDGCRPACEPNEICNGSVCIDDVDNGDNGK